MNARLIYWSEPCRSIKVLMTVHLIHQNARSMPWAGEEALALTGDKTRPAMTRAQGHQNPHLRPRSQTAGFWGAIVGPKDLAIPAHSISSPRPTSWRKKCPRTNKEGLNYEETLPRTILFSAIEITKGESNTPPRAVSQTVSRESTSAMRQPWEYSGRAIPG